MSLFYGHGDAAQTCHFPEITQLWCQRQDLDHHTTLPPCASPHLPTSRLCSICPSTPSLRLPDCDPLGTSPPTEVLN